jgi:hypothetical protein
MFRAIHRSSSGAQKLYLQRLVLHFYVFGCRPLAWLGYDRGWQLQTHVKSDAANTVFELLIMSDVSFETC